MNSVYNDKVDCRDCGQKVLYENAYMYEEIFEDGDEGYFFVCKKCDDARTEKAF